MTRLPVTRPTSAHDGARARATAPSGASRVARRVAVLLAALAAACGPADGAGDGAGGRRPNVVLVIIDTLRADMLSSYGHPADPSPALTRLAADGVQFDSVISQTSWTLPSIGSMLTSQYPRTLGLYDEGDQALPPHATTLAELLQEEGYATFGATANPNINSRAQFDQGFDEYVDSVVVFRESRDEVEEGEVFFRDARLHPAGMLIEKAVAFAEAQDPDTPVYLQLNFMEVHEYHKGAEVLRPPYRRLFAGEPQAPYLRTVRQVTDDVEAFVGRLRALPGWEDTFFCVTSDHGEGLTDHPAVSHSKGHGALLYPSQVHVPWLLFNASWTPTVHRVTRDVRLLELMPTLLDLVGVEPPPFLRGVSVAPLLEGAGEPPSLPEVLVTETYFRDFRKISAIGPDWQYVNNRGTTQGLPEHELQSRRGTPNGAETDRAAQHADVVDRLRRYVEAWESSHLEAPPLAVGEELSPEVREQLEAIGYFR